MSEIVKTILRIDSDLYERIKRRAEKEKRSINNMIAVLLEDKLNTDAKNNN